MTDESLSTLLGRFGLSDKEIDTYITVLEHGEAKPSTIATEADISKRHVYSVSEQLENKGFVEVNSHAVPTTVRAYPPEEVTERLRTNVESMESGLNELYREPEPNREEISVVKSKVTVIKRIQALIREANSEIALSVPARHLDELREDLKAAVDRGVLVVLIVSDVDDEVALNGYASVVRTWEEVMPTMLTIDSERGVFAPSELLVGSNTDQRGIVYMQEQLGPVIVGSFFGNYWPMTEEVMTPNPTSLPATYTSFRHTVLQATLHRREGVVDLHAEVTGRETGTTGPQKTISGEVIGVTQGLVKPTNNDFPVEHALLLDTGEETMSIGGQGAFVEDFEADSVTLRRP